jgi:TRAP transporter TAXI family solute receptor
VRLRTLAIFVGTVLPFLLPAILSARDLDTGTILTGGPDSPSTRFGRDIADLARRFGVRLRVEPSQDALESIKTMTQRSDTRFGIVQSSLLDAVADASENAEQHLKASLRIVFPLYAEEVHILARPEVARFADLRGRRVAVGAPRSSTLPTAMLLLARASVEPAEALRIGGDEALAALRKGRIDAMFYVASQPATLLRDKVAIEDALHLVPVEHPALRGLYPVSTIPADTYYPWQPRAVFTVAPRAVLTTLHWMGPGRQEEACRLVGKIARIVADNLGHLRRDGHPKWREVNLDAEVPGWERSPCAERALTGPESYVLDEARNRRPPRTSRSSPETGTVTQEPPAQ